MNPNDWKQDPRLKGMDEQKLSRLAALADQAGKTSSDKLMPLFMSLASGKGGMDFNDQETELIVSILTAGMSPAQKKQVETLRLLSKRLAGKGRAGKGADKKDS